MASTDSDERRGLDTERRLGGGEERQSLTRNRDKEIFHIEASRYTSLLYIYPFL